MFDIIEKGILKYKGRIIMIKIIDTYSQINAVFQNETFNLKKWELYINSIYENSADIFKKDLEEYLNSGEYVYDKDILPIINGVYGNSALDTLHNSFCKVTERLNERIVACFGKELDVDIVLYIGLCNAAGWVTTINGKSVILLGVEKILELNWQDENSMYGLIYHELGHMYHKQYGVFDQCSDDNKKNFVWQLFVEGIAMCFEQVLVNDFNYYHQDINGWKEWCDNHFQQILKDFNADLPTMTRFNQNYFGDWVNYYGQGDVGYYLGTKFVQYLYNKYCFEQLINMKIDDVYKYYLEFVDGQVNLSYYGV